jgi:Mg2+ and Co2+ transporter CorA
MFLASGAVGVGIVALKAYKAKLASKLEFARLEKYREAPDDEVQEQIRDLEDQVQRLTERLDFTEKLLSSGAKDTGQGD